MTQQQQQQQQLHDKDTSTEGSPSGWYYNVGTQVVLLGLIFLCVPGTAWNGFSSAGGGGIGDSDVTKGFMGVFNQCLNFSFGILSLFAPACINKMGPRVALFVGALGYPGTILVYLFVGRLELLPFGIMPVYGWIFGACAALLWTSGTGLLMAYPSLENRGFYLGIWWAIFNAGGAGSDFFIVFLGNLHSKQAAKANIGTFVAFATVGFIGCMLVASLAPAHKVKRSDGTPVIIPESPPVLEELRGMAKLVVSWRSLGMIPFMLYTNWCYYYQQQVFNTEGFDLPTSGLNAASYWLAQCVASILLSKVTDAPGVPVRTRAFRSGAIVAVVVGATWIVGLFMRVNVNCPGGGDLIRGQNCSLTDEDPPPIRFGKSDWYFPFILYTGWGVGDSLAQVWCMWVLAQFSDDSVTASRYAGLYKCFNSLGGAFGAVFGNMLSSDVQIWTDTVLFFVGMGLAAGICSMFNASDINERLVHADP